MASNAPHSPSGTSSPGNSSPETSPSGLSFNEASSARTAFCDAGCDSTSPSAASSSHDGAPPDASADPRWSAVVARDREADGRFYYSVRTTGVYCRPSCGARLARPENVRFHATPAEAERAGFRPCKRCRPDQAGARTRETELIAAACRRIEQAESPPALAELARQANLSRFHFHRVFKAMTGLTPKAYADARRAERVRGALAQGASVTVAMQDAGFGSSSRFYAQSTRMLGMPPSVYRNGADEQIIRYALTECTLGCLLVAATPVGICDISLGDDPDPLVAALRARFPRAQLIAGDVQLSHWVTKVVALIEQPSTHVDLPVDIRGTAFQQRVWQALRELPPGTTVSYTQLAARVGRPEAVRAVANACAANTLAVLIPCHRVVRSDGSISGYRWGPARKKALLRRESGG